MIRRIPRTGFFHVRARDTRFWIRKVLVKADIPEQPLGPRLASWGVSNLQNFAKNYKKAPFYLKSDNKLAMLTRNIGHNSG